MVLIFGTFELAFVSVACAIVPIADGLKKPIEKNYTTKARKFR